MRRARSLAVLFVVAMAGADGLARGQALSGAAQGAPGTASAPTPRPVRLAVIGDYGDGSPEEADVAALVLGWRPDLILTVGDNNYPDGEAATIDAHIGAFYHDYIGSYAGAYGTGSPTNRFFPALGNHDWHAPGALPYLAYFDLPGNERYYDLVRGPVHLLVVDSDTDEPDGIDSLSAQAAWLQSALASSTSPFKLVLLHHAPYSSGDNHGSTGTLQWPFERWGASAVLAGHDHEYERVQVGGIPMFVDGFGGAGLYTFATPLVGSQRRFALDQGALLVEVSPQRALFRAVTRSGVVVDSHVLTRQGGDADVELLVERGATWRFLDTGVDPGPGWTSPGFDDSAWGSGPAELGYGDGDEATVVSYGPSAAAKYMTTWFRHVALIPDPSAYERLELALLRDDGALVWINGVEALRSNLPAGPIGPTTPASGAVAGADEDGFTVFALDPALFHAGPNLIAVEVHQSSPTSSDISLDLELRGRLLGATLLPAGSTWRFLDTGVDPGPGWTSPGFDDSTWSLGPAQLGYGEGDETTVVGYGPDPLHKYPTTWMRTTFSSPSATPSAILSLRLLVDDGAVVWLNGHEAARFDLPLGAVGATQLAGYPVEGGDEGAWIETRLDPALLVPGVNLLAVEVHQDDPQTSDLSFDLELRAL